MIRDTILYIIGFLKPTEQKPYYLYTERFTDPYTQEYYPTVAAGLYLNKLSVHYWVGANYSMFNINLDTKKFTFSLNPLTPDFYNPRLTITYTKPL